MIITMGASTTKTPETDQMQNGDWNQCQVNTASTILRMQNIINALLLVTDMIETCIIKMQTNDQMQNGVWHVSQTTVVVARLSCLIKSTTELLLQAILLTTMCTINTLMVDPMHAGS